MQPGTAEPRKRLAAEPADKVRRLAEACSRLLYASSSSITLHGDADMG